MIRNILPLFILTLLMSCKTGEQENKKDIEGIRFDFSAERIDTYQETIEIKVKASLFNDNIDTIYFLSSTCNGEQYSLRYDTKKFTSSSAVCNVNSPILLKIAPKGKHDFQTRFRCSSNETKIKLGFDLYRVDKSFSIADARLGMFNRPEDEQTIIWANEKEIGK